MNTIFDKIGGTRFIGLTLVALIGTILTLAGRLDPDTFWTFLTVSFMAYAGARAYSAKKAAKNASIPPSDAEGM